MVDLVVRRHSILGENRVEINNNILDDVRSISIGIAEGGKYCQVLSLTYVRVEVAAG